MQILIKVIDREEFDKNMYSGIVYTHETFCRLPHEEIRTMHSDGMFARFIISLASMYNHKSYELFIHPVRPCITIQFDEANLSATITYYVKEL